MDITKAGHSKAGERRGAKRLYIALILAVLVAYVVVAFVRNGMNPDTRRSSSPDSGGTTQQSVPDTTRQ